MLRSNSSLIKAHSRGSFSRLIFESESNNGFGSKDRTIGFRLCQLFVLLTRSVTPGSYLFLTLIWWFNISPANFPGGFIIYYILVTWTLIEALFLPYYYYLFVRLSSMNDKLEHKAFDSESRLSLLVKCFRALEAGSNPLKEPPENYIRRVLEGWFLDAPLVDIYRENMASWTSWAFFGKDINEMTVVEKNENYKIVDYLEERAHWKFPPGYSAEIPPARLNLDPVFATQRPFLCYATIFAVQVGTHFALKHYFGFNLVPSLDSPNQTQRIYFRPKRKNSPPNDAHPVVFVHGIGIGFIHYFGLISSFPTDVDVFLVEWPHVTMQMATRGPTTEESKSGIRKLLKTFGHEKICVVAHSLGSVIVPWLLHDPELAPAIVGTVLIDPVCFLLCDPTVATVFVYKEHNNTIDFLMHFFLSRELFIANALSRHFAWSHNIMFVEDYLNNKKCCNSLNSYETEHGRSRGSSITEKRWLKIRSASNPDEKAGSLCDSNGYTSASTSGSEDNDENQINTMEQQVSGSLGRIDLNPSTVPSFGDSSQFPVRKPTRRFSRPNLQKTSEHSHIDHKDIEHTVILASHDSIVPTAPVARYLEYKQRVEGFSNYEVLMFHGLHGEMFVYPDWIRLISTKIQQRCGLIKKQ